MNKLILCGLMLGTALGAGAEGYLDRSAWKWSASSICAPEANSDIAGLPGIYDGDPATCWHSNWHAESGTPERSNPHWIMIDRGSDTSLFTAISYLPRQSTVNTACTSYMVYIADKDLSACPATTVSDIIVSMGEPEIAGSLAATVDEKIITLEKPTSARYILFVNVESSQSSSAACAEFNLIGPGGSQGGNSQETDAYNAIRMIPRMATDKPSQIAIQGNALTFSMNQGWLRMSNTDITVEYNLADIKSYKFIHYDFAKDESYVGNQKDVLTSKFDLAVVPSPAQVDTLRDIAIVPPSATRLNRSVDSRATLSGESGEIASFDCDDLDSLRAADGSYPLPTGPLTVAGDYTLTVPADMFIIADGSRSMPLEARWTVNKGQSAIADAAVQTLAFSRRGGVLTVSGITGSGTLVLIDTLGRPAATARITADGTAAFNVGSLTGGVYLLSVNNTTLKITL